MMYLSLSSICCALQIALLGAITPNVRKIYAKFTETNIDIYFYYNQTPSEEEEELSEKVSTEVISFYNDVMAQVHRIVLPYPGRIPKDPNKICVYSRWEKTPPDELLSP